MGRCITVRVSVYAIGPWYHNAGYPNISQSSHHFNRVAGSHKLGSGCRICVVIMIFYVCRNWEFRISNQIFFCQRRTNIRFLPSWWYTDDLQGRLSPCVSHVTSWMRSNRLQLNVAKTEVLWRSSVRHQHHIPITSITVGTTAVMSVCAARDLSSMA